jgi:hypothetical protein
MRFDPDLSREETLARMRADAKAAWGEERMAELRPGLEQTADAIWRVAQAALEPTELEP